MSERMAARDPRHLGRIVTLGIVVVVLALGAPAAAAAQAPPATEEQARSIERQLMCPVCPNERLDTSQNQVARDMKRIIREQLAQGRTPDDIILYFESRYGPIVRADLQAEGFNLLLFGWVGGSILAVSAGGAWYLWALKRRQARSPLGTSPPPFASEGSSSDDAWLDQQLASGESSATETERGVGNT